METETPSLDFESATRRIAPLAVESVCPPDVVTCVEYSAPNDEKWRIERGADLIVDFELSDSAHLETVGEEIEKSLTAFHRALSGQDPAWTMICRIYGVAPLYGVEDFDEIRAWTIAELAEKRGIEPRDVMAQIEGAKVYWRQWRLNEGKSTGLANVRSPRAVPDDETAEQLLRENGFGEIADQEEKGYVASRIQQLDLYLESDHLRSAARALIQQEVGIFFVLDPTIRDFRQSLAKRADKKPTEKESKQLLDMMRERRDAQTALDASMKVLGLADSQGNSLKKRLAFNDCVSTMLQAFQNYHSENDRHLIDGVFTAAEVELLTTPAELRPAQYRPDLIVSIYDASKHLWEKDWSPTPQSRRACRKLRKGFAQGIAEARSDEGETTGEVVVEDELEISESETADAGMAPLEANTTLPQTTFPSRASTADEPAVMLT